MTQAQQIACSSNAWLAKAVGLFGLVLLPATANADQPDVSIDTTLGFGRGAQLHDDGGNLAISFEMNPTLLATATAVQPRGANAQLIYGADLEVTGNSNAYGSSGVVAGVNGAYQRKFGENNRWQYRIKGEVDRAYSEADWAFHRERLGVQLKYRHNPKHTTTSMVRFGYREQHEDQLPGFDQYEYLGQVMHMWRPNKDRLAVAGTVYAETRDADLERFSYEEAGLRLMVRVPLSETTEITARSTFYQRAYEDPFSQFSPTIREDERIKAVVEVDHVFTEKLSGNAYAGWDENTSNIAERAHADATFGVSVTYNWD